MSKKGLILNDKKIEQRLVNTLSSDFIVLAVMYEGQINDNKYNFTEIVEKLDGLITKNRISSAEDRLFDLGLINSSYKKKDGKFSKRYIVLGESELMAKEILDYLEGERDISCDTLLRSRDMNGDG